MENKLYFSTREYVFAAMMVAGKMVSSSAVIPLTLPLQIPGLANIINGPLSAFFLTLGITRLRKPGSLILIAGLYALVCLPINWIIFSFVITAGIAGELVGSAIFRGYKTKASRMTSALAYQLVMWPAAMLYAYLGMPKMYDAVPWHVFIGIELAIAATSTIGVLLAFLVSKELIKAGKLRVDD